MIKQLREFKIGPDNAFYGTGKRKESIARVWLVKDTNKQIVKAKDSGKEFDLREYLQRRPFIER